MQFLRPTSSPAKTALTYITIGSLTIVWTVVYWLYRVNHATDDNPVPSYWLGGFLARGLTLLVMGLATGQIGRAARPAEATPPAVVTAPPGNNQPPPQQQQPQQQQPQAQGNPVAPNQIPPGQLPNNQV